VTWGGLTDLFFTDFCFQSALLSSVCALIVVRCRCRLGKFQRKMETLEAQKHNKPSAPMAMRKQHSLDQLAAQNTSQIEELSVEAADDTTSNSMDTGSNSEATQQGSEAESGAE
jgi:hypothetical protein